MKKDPLAAVDFAKGPLLPAIVQDIRTKEVLMQAYMNREALEKTLELGETVFWSRSREELWHKGESSGNTQKVIRIRTDCDGDSLLIEVESPGPACHTGARSCFYQSIHSIEGGEDHDAP